MIEVRLASTRGSALPALILACVLGVASPPLDAQEPVAWGDELVFHTFSIVAVDPATGESGVTVTTRVPCVGNGVPWVRAGVGAVATQASTRTAYGDELLDMLEQGLSPQDALARATAADEQAERRQVGLIALDGSSAQHTGTGPGFWAGHRSGVNYATQGNVLVGPEVLDAVAANFEASEESGRHLADRLIEALAAGQAAGGDRRGRQSAALIVRGPHVFPLVDLRVDEHPDPVKELRRIFEVAKIELFPFVKALPTAQNPHGDFAAVRAAMAPKD